MDLKDLTIDLEAVADPNLRRCIAGLLNIVQQQAEQITRLQAENRALRDEIARLKGEQGRPNVLPNKPSAPPTDHSSEKRRKQPRNRTVKRKALDIDRTVPCPVDRAILPPDAEFKGTARTVIQDVVFRRDNIAFEREKFYSPSQGKTYYGPLPPGYAGYRFGPGVRALALVLYYATGTSEPKIVELFAHVGVRLSTGALSDLLIHDLDTFHAEKAAIQAAGLASSPWQQIDDTATRVDGVGHHCHVLGNPLFTIYSTQPAKDRLTVIDVLRGQDGHRFRVNDAAVAHAAAVGVPAGHLTAFGRLPWDRELDTAAFTAAFDAELAWAGVQTRKKLFEAAAIAAYRAQTAVPVVDTLLGDDAGQFDDVTAARALCWIHEGRHYAKLTPLVPAFQAEVDTFLDRFWAYYAELRAYRQAPSDAEATRLCAAFDVLFSATPAYGALAARIASTRANKTELLCVLEHPELPLHNNDSELAARQRVRKRDVSFGPRTSAGARAWDTMQSVVATATKLGVNAYAYIADRVGGLGAIVSLATEIQTRAATLNLGASWALPAPSG